MMPKTTLVHGRVKLSLKSWKLGILSGFAQSRREQDLIQKDFRSRTSTSWYSLQEYSWNGKIEENSWITSRWILQEENWSRIKTLFISSWPRYRNCTIHEINCMNDSREFRDAESVRSGQISHVPCEPAFFPLLAAEPRQKSAAWNLECAWYFGKRFRQFSCVLFDTLF